MGKGNNSSGYPGSLVLLLILTVTQLELQKEIVSAQDCLQAAGRGEGDERIATPFQNLGGMSSRLPSGTQAIITSYKFGCCANITAWQTYVHPGGGMHQQVYDITFQVWRPSPTEPESGCYSMVGSNIFTSISLGGGGLVNEAPAPSNILMVRPGDVVGYYTLSRKGDGDGIQLETDNEYDGNTVWHTRENPPVMGQEYCHAVLTTTAAPILSVCLSTSTCPPTPRTMIQPTRTSSTPPSTSSTHPTFTSTSSTNPTFTTTSFPYHAPVTSSVISSSSSSQSHTIQNLGFQFTNDPTTKPPSRSADFIGVVVSILATVIVVVVVIAFTVTVTLVLMKKSKSKPERNARNDISNPNYDFRYADIPTTGSVQSSTDRGLDYNQYSYPQLPPPKTSRSTKNYNDQIYQEICPGEGTKPTVPPKLTKTSTTTEDDYAYCPPDFASANAKSSYYSLIGEDLDYIDKDRGYSLLEPEYYVLEDGETVCSDSESYATPEAKKCVDKGISLFEASGLVVPSQKERKSKNSDDIKIYNKLNFFVVDPIYWVPAKTPEEIYDQLASRKFREIPRKQITILEHLGSGQFGTVSKALWTLSSNSLVVAIKNLQFNASNDARVKLLQEAAIMGQFFHTNVVKIYGLITIGNPLIVCLEYMKNGDLKGYVSTVDLKRDAVPNGHKDIQCFFIQAAKDIANGMNYLSSKAFVHRDLAARNVLLDEYNTCKIGDFGMARDLMDDMYYTARGGGKIPIKWTAPEALLYKKYSSDSDVWSYGMVLFEIWTLGKRPFSSTANNQLLKLIQTGFCQTPPPGCPRAMYKLMVDCWNPLHEHRPKFAEICNYLYQPVSKLLYWSPNDSLLSPSVTKLGAALEEAEKLYTDLQHKYQRNRRTQ